MPVHAWVVRHVTFPLAQRRQGVLRRLDALQRMQWLSSDELQARQLARLRALLAHAYARSPFYREAFDQAGVRPEGVDALADLSRLPVLEKAELRMHGSRILTLPTRRGLAHQRTSGSTGVPLDLWISREARAASVAASLRLMQWWGIAIGERRLALVSRRSKRGLTRLAQFLLTNRLEHPATQLTEQGIARIHRWITRGGVSALIGYPSSLEYLAHRVAALGDQPTSLRAVGATGEVLTSHHRALFQRAFGCPVYNDYGTNETGHIAGECPEGRMHVAEHILVEHVRLDGEEELLLTDLANTATPLIRYRIGDLGTAGDPCPCGRGLSVLRLTKGRTAELVVLPDGRRADFTLLASIFDDLAGEGVPIYQYRVTQRALDRFEVMLAGPPSLAGAADLVRRRVRAAVAAPVSVAVETGAHVPPLPSGKRPRFVPLPGGTGGGDVPHRDRGVLPAAEMADP